MNVQLLRAVRLVVRADSDPARQALFATLLRSRPDVRLACGLHAPVRGTWTGALLVGASGLASFFGIAPPRNRGARVIAIAQHENARRQVGRLFDWIGDEDCGLVRTGRDALLSGATASALGTLFWRGAPLSLLRIIRRIDRQHGFLVSCRASAAMAWYTRGLDILDATRPRAVLVSSDSNPEEVGFVAAARTLRIPQIFVSHAYPTPLSPPLDFTLSIVEGEAAVDARRRKGPIKGDVLLAGVEGESGRLDASRFERPNPVIGIFTSKALSWPTLAAIVDDCRKHFRPSRIVIRWHPSMLERPRLASTLDDMTRVVESPRSARLADVARECDWVIADENSNVHLPVLKLGIPTVAVKHLGVYPETRADQYGFAANGVIFPPLKSIRDAKPDALRSFFSNGWQARFERYDASYLRPADAIRADVQRAIYQLLEEPARQAEFVAT
jgi:hypothetical protein